MKRILALILLSSFLTPSPFSRATSIDSGEQAVAVKLISYEYDFGPVSDRSRHSPGSRLSLYPKEQAKLPGEEPIYTLIWLRFEIECLVDQLSINSGDIEPLSETSIWPLRVLEFPRNSELSKGDKLTFCAAGELRIDNKTDQEIGDYLKNSSYVFVMEYISNGNAYKDEEHVDVQSVYHETYENAGFYRIVMDNIVTCEKTDGYSEIYVVYDGADELRAFCAQNPDDELYHVQLQGTATKSATFYVLDVKFFSDEENVAVRIENEDSYGQGYKPIDNMIENGTQTITLDLYIAVKMGTPLISALSDTIIYAGFSPTGAGTLETVQGNTIYGPRISVQIDMSKIVE